MKEENQEILSLYEMLIGIVKKTKISLQLLERPPFSFLHALLVELLERFNLFTELQLDSKQLKTKEMKAAFLTKALAFVTFALSEKQNLSHGVLFLVSPVKVLAGLEVHRTFIFLKDLVILVKSSLNLEILENAKNKILLKGETFFYSLGVKVRLGITKFQAIIRGNLYRKKRKLKEQIKQSKEQIKQSKEQNKQSKEQQKKTKEQQKTTKEQQKKTKDSQKNTNKTQKNTKKTQKKTKQRNNKSKEQQINSYGIVFSKNSLDFSVIQEFIQHREKEQEQEEIGKEIKTIFKNSNEINNQIESLNNETISRKNEWLETFERHKKELEKNEHKNEHKNEYKHEHMNEHMNEHKNEHKKEQNFDNLTQNQINILKVPSLPNLYLPRGIETWKKRLNYSSFPCYSNTCSSNTCSSNTCSSNTCSSNTCSTSAVPKSVLSISVSSSSILKDKNKENKIEEKEILKRILKEIKSLMKKKKLKLNQVFHPSNLNKNKILTISETIETLSHWNILLTRKEATILMHSMDIYGNGRIGLKEFEKQLNLTRNEKQEQRDKISCCSKEKSIKKPSSSILPHLSNNTLNNQNLERNNKERRKKEKEKEEEEEETEEVIKKKEENLKKKKDVFCQNIESPLEEKSVKELIKKAHEEHTLISYDRLCRCICSTGKPTKTITLDHINSKWLLPETTKATK